VVATPSRLTVLAAGLSLVAGGLLVGAAAPSQAVPGARIFAGTNVGAIPDGGSSCSPSPGTPRDVTFNVTGMGAAAPADVRVTGLLVSHTFIGDLTVTLIAPDGTTQRALFGRTGAITAAGLGDNSNLAGPYTFADDAAGNWWSTASSTNDSTAIAAGSYRTSGVGGAGGGPGPDPGTLTQLTSAFAGVTHPNGTWKLRFVDSCGQTLGTVTAATLELVPGPCAAEKERLEVAQAGLGPANAAVPPATAAAEAADQAVVDASAAVSKATKAVTKATKALKKAKASGNAAKIKKAKKKLKAAKSALEASEAALAAARQGAATAHQKLTTAQAAAAAAQAELTAANHALAAC
jgi:subtilisin-like proprotein convertase family protein